jgi:hypothetical protein
MGAHSLQQLQPVHSRHHNIGDNQVNALFLQQRKPFMPVSGSPCGIAVIIQIYSQQLLNFSFVINNKNGFDRNFTSALAITTPSCPILNKGQEGLYAGLE